MCETFHTGLTVSFKEPSYTVDEDGGSINVCVLLSKTSSATVTVTLDDVAGSASGGNVLHS